MSETTGSRSELLALAARYRHLRAEAGRAGEGGSTRRRLEAQMRDAGEHAERRIAELVEDEEDRRAWRDHVHHGSPAPPRPQDEAPAGESRDVPERPEGRRPWPR